MSQKLSLRQTRLRNQLPMIGNSVDELGDSVLSKIDAELAKLFEDRNALLTDGGIITFTGTSVQFTESLKLSLNSKIDGSVQVIDLGSTTRSLSASGRMLYAVIDRINGTATVTADATALPSVVAANQEVFLIAKRVDAADGTQRIYFRNGSGLNAGQSVRLGASGSGSGGSGTGDDLGNLTFKASFVDTFEDIPTSATSAVDTGTGKTDSTLYSAVNALFQLNYDASKTVTGTGTSMTLSATPGFTVKQGDMLIVAGQARRITTVTTQTSYTIESAFTTNPTAAQATVSQAVYSKDLNNFAGDGLAISTAFSTSINQIMAVYEDTSTSGDKIFDANTIPVIGFSASSDGSSFTDVQTRPTNLSDSIPLINLPTSGSNLYLRFFANKTSGSGTVNVLGYKVFLHADTFSQDGSQLNQSYGLTNGAGTEINISSISVVGAKTRIKKTWSYPVGVNPGTTNGSLKVYLDGKKIPRFVDSTITPSASYREIDQNTIELDQDYSASPLSIEIIQDVAVIDVSDTNVTNISQVQESISQGFQPFVNTSLKLNSTSTPGAPAAGSFYSSILNRSSISDISQDLKSRMGIERIITQNLYEISSEFGPNGEPVYGVYGDTNNLIRLVGLWSTNISSDGSLPLAAANTATYAEITFFGTGLNMLGYTSGVARDARATVDGGTEGANFMPSGANILNNRNYANNIVIPVVSGLTLGVHTVKIRNATASFNLPLYGFEVINNRTNVLVTPGTSYSSGKKMVSSSQNSLSYNSVFESGTLGTRGGRVVVYQKADGSIVKAVQPVDASTQLNTSANHANEEIYRMITPIEFGANRADDFSTLTTSASARAFTLDDGVTTLTATAAAYYTNPQGQRGVSFTDGNNTFGILTFVGTGLDIELFDSLAGGADQYQFQIDGGAAQNFPYTTGSTIKRVYRIASGLPYGTHTFRLLRNTAATFSPAVTKFIIYQPKKPTIPTSSVELADYNILSNYTTPVTNGVDVVAPGIIRKYSTREFIYNGTFTASLDASTSLGGWNISSTTNGNFIEYTFFGSGFEIRHASASNLSYTISVDGSTNLTGFTFTSYGNNITLTASTGTVTTALAQNGQGVSVNGLSLGIHTVRLTKTAGTSGLAVQAFDIITPIHSIKTQNPYDQQNTILVGSCAISDNRNITIVKDISNKTKNVSQAFGVASNVSTTSTTPIPVPDLSVVHINSSGKIKISYSMNVNAGTNVSQSIRIYVDGNMIPGQPRSGNFSTTTSLVQSDVQYLNVSPGSHKIDVYWSVGAGTVSSGGTERSLLVEEL